MVELAPQGRKLPARAGPAGVSAVTLPLQLQQPLLQGFGRRAGWQVLPELELRGGLFFDDSGVNPAYFNPSLPDAKKVVATVGAGWEVMKNLSLDAAFLYSWFLDLNSVPAPSTPALPNASSFAGTAVKITWDESGLKQKSCEELNVVDVG